MSPLRNPFWGKKLVIKTLCAAVYGLIIVLSTHTVWAEGVGVGKVTQLRGKVKIFRNAIIKSTLKLHDTFRQKDVVQTKRNAAVELTMTEGSVISLGDDTQIDISRYVTGTVPEAILKQSTGRVYIVVADVFDTKKESFQVQTPQANIGVRGTKLEIHVEPDGTYVRSHAGHVSIRSKTPGISTILNLERRQAAFIGSDKPPTLSNWPSRLKGFQ